MQKILSHFGARLRHRAFQSSFWKYCALKQVHRLVQEACSREFPGMTRDKELISELVLFYTNTSIIIAQTSIQIILLLNIERTLFLESLS